MGKRNMGEIAGARCAFCGIDADETPDRKMVKGLKAFACTACLRRCRELLAVCPEGGVRKFK